MDKKKSLLVPQSKTGIRTASPAWNVLLSIAILVVFVVTVSEGFGQAANNNKEKDELIDQYVQSKGSSNIVFDSSNIKQFWVNTSVISENETINILLQKHGNLFNSEPLRIQLANVNESLDCKVEIITESPDVSFVVTNNQSKKISKSSPEEDFIKYHVLSSVFHLEQTTDYIFNLIFESQSDIIPIKKILLSFSKNNTGTYRSTPGVLKITNDNIALSGGTTTSPANGDSFSMTGKNSQALSRIFILTGDTVFKSSITIKNTGNIPTHIYVGYQSFNENKVFLRRYHFPYNDASEMPTVISSKEGSKIVIVDSYPEWKKGCYLALDAKDDLSDIPNTKIAPGKITQINKLEDGRAEIVFDTDQKAIKPGTKVRIHGFGGEYIYTNNKVLQPGEEETFVSEIKKDNNVLEYSQTAFSIGTFYVKPVVLSFSTSNEENTVLISDYTISY